MSARGFTHRPEMKSHNWNEKTRRLKIKVKLDFTCINKRPRRLIWSSHTLIFISWLGKRKRYVDPKEEEGKKKKDEFLGLGLLVLGLGSLSLVLEEACTCLVIYIEEVLFARFSTPWGFPRVYCCCLCDCVSISDPCAYCFREFARIYLI